MREEVSDSHWLFSRMVFRPRTPTRVCRCRERERVSSAVGTPEGVAVVTDGGVAYLHDGELVHALHTLYPAHEKVSHLCCPLNNTRIVCLALLRSSSIPARAGFLREKARRRVRRDDA